jgi:hypothetical protein
MNRSQDFRSGGAEPGKWISWQDLRERKVVFLPAAEHCRYLSSRRTQMNSLNVKSSEASQLRRGKYELVRQFGIPENLLPRLRLGHRRCGRANCRCADGVGHPQWSLSLSHRSGRRIEHVPVEWAEEVEQVFLDTQAFLDAMQEVMAINLELFTMARRQHRSRRTSAATKRPSSEKSGKK